MSGKVRDVVSRECKIMLEPALFSGSQADVHLQAENFRKALGIAIKDSVLPDGTVLSGLGFQVAKPEKQSLIQFFDTTENLLRKSAWIFRQRQPLGGGPLELTLKCRHPDRFFVSASEADGETKFEEDVKVNRTQDFISLYSLSGKIEQVDSDTKFRKLKDISEFFKPLKKQMGDAYDPRAKLVRVGNFQAKQTVLEGVRFQLDNRVAADCGLILWYSSTEKPNTPALVEFSFRYSTKSRNSKQEALSKDIAGRSHQVLHRFRDPASPLAKWVALDSPTKTQFVYQLTGSTSESAMF